MIFHKSKAHWECTWKGLHQERKLQWSSITKKLEQEKELKTEHQANKEWRRRDLIAWINRSVPSKHLLFLSCQRHHNTQCGIARHRSILHCLPNGPCQEANKSATLWGITQITPKRLQTIDQSLKAMGQWRRRWFIDSPLLLHI